MPGYASYTDLEKSIDQVIVAQLCTDSGTPMPGDNPVAQFALERGKGVIRAYAMVGARYTDADLNSLATAGDPMLIGMNVDLAIEFLFQRRGSKIPPAIDERLKRAYSALEALRDGRLIFGSVASAVAASTPEVTVVPQSNLNWYAKVSNMPFFPRRRNSTSPG